MNLYGAVYWLITALINSIAVPIIAWLGNLLWFIRPATDFVISLLRNGAFLNFIVVFAEAFIMLIYIALFIIILLWFERKMWGRFQDRRGPMHVGYAGLLQIFADMMKIFGKEDIIPRKADKLLFTLCPIIVTATAFLALVALPMSDGFVVAKLDGGLLFVFAAFSLAPLGVFIGGWGANNKYTLQGAVRGAAQMISYEVPLLFSVLGVVILAGSFNIMDIVHKQSIWYVLLQPIGFFVFFTAATAEIERPPFDIPEAESELVAGWQTEYSGMKYGICWVAEWIRMYVGAALVVLLFFGGWSGPWLPQEIWFQIKLWVILVVMIWVRQSFPRPRIDQLLSIGWRRLLPLSIVNIVLTIGIVASGWLG